MGSHVNHLTTYTEQIQLYCTPRKRSDGIWLWSSAGREHSDAFYHYYVIDDLDLGRRGSAPRGHVVLELCSTGCASLGVVVGLRTR
eukprot:2542884-Prymnesium_polylepis.1